MAEVVNLRQARKRLARQASEDAAAQNRVRFGTPKALRQSVRAERHRSERALEAHKLETPGEIQSANEDPSGPQIDR